MVAITKYTKAKQAANARYDEKTYREFNIKLRVEDDADIIASLEEAKKQKIPYREWLRKFFEGE